MPAGRPLKFKDPAELEALGKAYLERCKEEGEHPQVSGLALALGMCSLQMLSEYEQRPEFGAIIKSLKLAVITAYERSAMTNRNPAGPIFILKNLGWSDRQELVTSISGSLALDPGEDRLTDEQLAKLIELIS